MLRDAVIVAEILLVAIGSGIAAGLILRTDLPLHWLLCAGLVGVVLEPAIHVNFGPRLFHHSVLVSIGTAALVIILVRVANLILQTWHHQFHRS
jgi:hypothetical protein